jgi:hypothetical protein
MHMSAIQIRVNGKLVATCGAGALRKLVATVAARRVKPPSDAKILRAAEPDAVYWADPGADEVLKWVTSRIALGDAISLTFLDPSAVHVPGTPELPERPSKA